MKEDRQDPETEYDLPNDTGDLQLEASLRAAFLRHQCPDTMILGDFQAGWLDEKETAQIKAHLTRCDDCQAELTRLGAFLAVEETEQEAVEATSAVPWQVGLGFEWQLREAGRMVIRLISDALMPPQPQFAAIAVKGQSDANDPTIVRHIVLTPEEVDDLDLEIIIRQLKPDGGTCTVQVRAEVPSRWPDLAGVTVVAQAADWQAEAITDDDGQVNFSDLPAQLVDQLVVEARLSEG
ncbi:MAG: hypothetical protein AAF629_10225 [Chloroflexota bacterium]